MSKISDNMKQLSYGLYAVLTMDGDRPTGCIMNTVFQISNDPVTVAIGINKNNYTADVIRSSGRFSVSILSEQSPRKVITDLGFRSGRDCNKLEELSYSMVDGLPVLNEQISGAFTCQVESVADAGTHYLILAKVSEAVEASELRPMTYRYYHENVKNAPVGDGNSVKYVCDICGYVHEGDINDEPDDYRCPMCGVLKSYFKKA